MSAQNADTSEYWTAEDEEFWAPICWPDGCLDVEQVMRELHDYRFVLREVPRVYCHITDGRVSKPNTCADQVIAVHDDVCQALDFDGGVCDPECRDPQTVCSCDPFDNDGRPR